TGRLRRVMKLSYFPLAFVLSSGVLVVAQHAGDEPKLALDAGPTVAAASVTDEPTATDPPPTKGPQTPNGPQGPGTARLDQWHISVTPYLWFPGVHGNVGALDRDISVHASAIDVLSHFRFGLMAFADARWKRLVLPLDVFWVRLQDDNAAPFPNLAATTADVKAGAFILTPKVGYRLADREKIKLDVLTGFRYWHLSQDLKFSPSSLNLNVSPSQNWVDPLVGVRIQTPVSKKFEVNLTGDVGGWGVGSELDYQVA